MIDTAIVVGHIKSQRPCRRPSRFGQSALSNSFHFIILPLRPYFSISRAKGETPRF
jgi:hypothetical protein